MEVGIFIAKYSYELKKEVVLEYINGIGGYASLCKKYNTPNMEQMRRWISAYEKFGDKGLKRSREKKNYSFEFKLSVVELYLTTEVSYQELALSIGITNPSIITHWVNDCRKEGSDALRPKRKGWKPQVPKSKKTIPITEKEIHEIRKERKNYVYEELGDNLKSEISLSTRKKYKE